MSAYRVISGVTLTTPNSVAFCTTRSNFSPFKSATHRLATTVTPALRVRLQPRFATPLNCVEWLIPRSEIRVPVHQRHKLRRRLSALARHANGALRHY